MHGFSNYFSEDEILLKKDLLYDLMGRPTIEFSPKCAKSISEAIEQLDLVEKLEDQDPEDLNFAIYITCWAFADAHLIYLIVNTICLCKTTCRVKLCYRVNNLVYSCIFLVTSTSLWIMGLINMIMFLVKAATLKEWQEFSPCLDSYMAITDF